MQIPLCTPPHSVGGGGRIRTPGETPRKPSKKSWRSSQCKQTLPLSRALLFLQTLFHLILSYWILGASRRHNSFLTDFWKGKETDAQGQILSLTKAGGWPCVHIHYLPHTRFFGPLNSCHWQKLVLLEENEAQNGEMINSGLRPRKQESQKSMSDFQTL